MQTTEIVKTKINFKSGIVGHNFEGTVQLDYYQYLLISQINYTIINYTDHTRNAISHKAIGSYEREDRLTQPLVCEYVRSHIETSPRGYVVFGDTVPDKNKSRCHDMLYVSPN